MYATAAEEIEKPQNGRRFGDGQRWYHGLVYLHRLSAKRSGEKILRVNHPDGVIDGSFADKQARKSRLFKLAHGRLLVGIGIEPVYFRSRSHDGAHWPISQS